jgi:hypothetical protein
MRTSTSDIEKLGMELSLDEFSGGCKFNKPKTRNKLEGAWSDEE